MKIESELMTGGVGIVWDWCWTLDIRNNGMKKTLASDMPSSRLQDQTRKAGKEQV